MLQWFWLLKTQKANSFSLLQEKMAIPSSSRLSVVYNVVPVRTVLVQVYCLRFASSAAPHERMNSAAKSGYLTPESFRYRIMGVKVRTLQSGAFPES